MGDSSPANGSRLSIDFSVPDIFVRSILNPAKTGHTTGRVVRQAGRDYALLRLKSGELGQVPCEHLELVPEIETRTEAVGKLRLAGPQNLHRAILTEKMRGRLTDIFYSMGTGHADFYGHSAQWGISSYDVKIVPPPSNAVDDDYPRFVIALGLTSENLHFHQYRLPSRYSAVAELPERELSVPHYQDTKDLT